MKRQSMLVRGARTRAFALAFAAAATVGLVGSGVAGAAVEANNAIDASGTDLSVDSSSCLATTWGDTSLHIESGTVRHLVRHTEDGSGGVHQSYTPVSIGGGPDTSFWLIESLVATGDNSGNEYLVVGRSVPTSGTADVVYNDTNGSLVYVRQDVTVTIIPGSGVTEIRTVDAKAVVTPNGPVILDLSNSPEYTCF